ncbi:hypothetical protein [Streptomyces sp. LN325]|uniref:hypothetical protein n=1 Tax=Streptomyces sp. LN325 TaxID=3112976 RepID=UPI003712263E
MAASPARGHGLTGRDPRSGPGGDAGEAGHRRRLADKGDATAAEQLTELLAE